MPALTANSVTLDEILEVRAGPLKEEELWAILSHSSEALQDVLIKGITVNPLSPSIYIQILQTDLYAFP